MSLFGPCACPACADAGVSGGGTAAGCGLTTANFSAFATCYLVDDYNDANFNLGGFSQDAACFVGDPAWNGTSLVYSAVFPYDGTWYFYSLVTSYKGTRGIHVQLYLENQLDGNCYGILRVFAYDCTGYNGWGLIWSGKKTVVTADFTGTYTIGWESGFATTPATLHVSVCPP